MPPRRPSPLVDLRIRVNPLGPGVKPVQHVDAPSYPPQSSPHFTSRERKRQLDRTLEPVHILSLPLSGYMDCPSLADGHGSHRSLGVRWTE